MHTWTPRRAQSRTQTQSHMCPWQTQKWRFKAGMSVVSPNEIWRYYLSWTQREVNTGKPDGHCSQLYQWQPENDPHKQAEMICVLYLSVSVWHFMCCILGIRNVWLTCARSYMDIPLSNVQKQLQKKKKRISFSHNRNLVACRIFVERLREISDHFVLWKNSVNGLSDTYCCCCM